MAVLTTSHERALTLLFSELERGASEQSTVLLGTPGTLAERTNETGTRFWVHRYSDGSNRRQETYIGKVDSPEARVPVPERYAIHKLIVSQLRNKTSSKPEKDLRQAATLIEALVERYPGAIEDAASAVPKTAARHIARALKALERHLPASASATFAWAALAEITPTA